MSIFDRFNRPQQLFAASELPTPNTISVDAASEVLAAAERVSKRFGAQTNKDVLAAALTASKTQADFAAAFKAANIGIIDTADALRYRSERTKATVLDRLKSWSRVVYQTFMHGGFGRTSALVAAILTVPASIMLAIDTFWYDVDFFWSTPAIWLALFMGPMIFAPSDTGNKEKDQAQFDAYFSSYGRLYAGIHGLMFGLPVWLLTTLLFGIWFHKGDSSRSWVNSSVSDYQKPLPNPVVLSIDQVLEVLPKAKIELDILQPAQGEKDEMFVTLPLGGTDDRLYLWHEPA